MRFVRQLRRRHLPRKQIKNGDTLAKLRKRRRDRLSGWSAWSNGGLLEKVREVEWGLNVSFQKRQGRKQR